MGTKSREHLQGPHGGQPGNSPRRNANKLACDAWTKRMLGFRGSAQPSPTLGDAINASYCFLEIRCGACGHHSTLDLTTIRRPKETSPSTRLNVGCIAVTCSSRVGYRVKRGLLVALRPEPISATAPPSVWWPGER